jgi:outer membrane protein assembly factor BamB
MRVFLVLVALTCSACSSVEKWQAESQSRRVFKTEKKWVRATTTEPNLKFRKLNRFQPLIYKDLVIQGNGLDGIAAYTRDGGHLKWRLPITNGVESTGTLINDRLFFGALDGQFYSIDADDGSVLWTFPTRIETLSEPLLVDGVVYILTGNNSLYALDAATGKKLWIYSRQETSALSIRGGSRPAFKNGSLFVGFSDGSLVSLLAETGTVKWEKQLSRNKRFRDLDTDVVVDGDALYLVGFDDAIYCLRTATGEEVWKNKMGGYGRPLVVQDLLYVATTSSELLALKKDTGAEVWRKTVFEEGIASSPSFYKGVVAYGESSGSLKFVDSKTGKDIAHFQPGRGVFAQPQIDEKNNRAYFMSNEANLWALDIGWSIPNWIPFVP